MKPFRFGLYQVDRGYREALAKVDRHVMPVPEDDAETWPPVWILVDFRKRAYCIPVSAPKEKHTAMKNLTDFFRIMEDGKCIGVLNLNGMIPVREDLLHSLELNPMPGDPLEMTQYKNLAKKQLDVCEKSRDTIRKRAVRLYDILAFGWAGPGLVARCCDFRALEQVLREYPQTA